MELIQSIIREESYNDLKERELEKEKAKSHNQGLTDPALKTKKKSFISEQNPNLIKRNDQKDTYIWFGVYDELMRNKNFVNILSKCSDTSVPLECAAIHLEGFQIYFGSSKINNKSNEVKAFITEMKDSVVFLKLYLISKKQFVDVLKKGFGMQFDEKELFTKYNKQGK